MNNFSDLIERRRSVRKFSDAPLTDEQVRIILNTALRSPSSKNSKPWQFIAIEDKDILGKLSECKDRGSKPIKNASLAVVVLGDPMKSDVWIEDCSIASIMMQLQAEDLGLGSCWIQIRNRLTTAGTSSEEFVKNLLNIPAPLEVLSVIIFGNRTDVQNSIRNEDIEWKKIHINKY
ncbi:MAG: nitroreductase family protein [Dysgonomonas sp.]